MFLWHLIVRKTPLRRRKEGKKERRKEGKKERREEGKKERRKEGREREKGVRKRKWEKGGEGGEEGEGENLMVPNEDIG